ncbi:MAG: BBP7 family outer membrane beta-barrel protein [Pirellulales bacterium]
MRLHKYQLLAAFGLLLAVVAAKAQAQVNLPFGPENYSHDFQLFAPVEIDLDNEPSVDDHGYMFSYSKLAWSFGGERVEVGDPNVEVFAEEIYTQNPDDIGVRPEPYQIQNGLQNVYPKSGFGLGDRYEIGYRDRGNGWMIGILDGPLQQQSQVYGMTPTLTGTTLPPWDLDYRGAPLFPGDDPAVPTPGPLGTFFSLGFGNVHINFDTPAGYLMGFRDYLNFLAGAAIGTQVGPVAYVGNYGGTQEPDTDDDGTITFIRLTDDINENGIIGAVIIIDPVTGLLTTMTDFGDLHTFNIAFDQVIVRTRAKMNGVEAMWSHELTNRHYQAQHQNNHFELGAGARFLQFEDYFSFLGDGGVLGRTFSNTWLDNQIVGPQVRAKWVNQRQRWRLSGTTSFLFGYNSQNWRQENGIGAELVPGATNRFLYGQPTYSTHGLQKRQFSPVGELRLESAYYLTQALALKVGYTGMYVGNIKRAATSVRYYLPDMGYRNSGNQNLITNGVDVGIEFVY